MHLVGFAGADETRHAPPTEVGEIGPSTWRERNAASSAIGSFFSTVHVRSGSGKW
jgi:hypothetical protein